MVDFRKLETQLEGFGLSKKQAVIYIQLVQSDVLRIQELVTLTNIPRSSIYESLKGLYEMGLIEEIVKEHHKVIKPYPIDSMRHRIDEKIKEYQKQASGLDTLMASMAALPEKKSGFKAEVRYYSDTAGARQIHWNTLKAQNTLYTYSELGRVRYIGLHFYENFVEEYKSKDIKQRVLINPTPLRLEGLRYYLDSPASPTSMKDIKAIDQKSVKIRGEIYIYNNIYAQVILENEKISGFEIESQQFVETQRSIFETLWKTAKPVTQYL